MDNKFDINMENSDAAGSAILRLMTQVALHEVPNKDNKAKAMYVMAATLVRSMQAVSSLVGWPGANFSQNDDRDHLGMYDYINDASKTFAALLIARMSKEDEQTTLITCSPEVLVTALRQTEMIHGSLEGKIEPAIIDAAQKWEKMPQAEKRSFMEPVYSRMQ